MKVYSNKKWLIAGTTTFLALCIVENISDSKGQKERDAVTPLFTYQIDNATLTDDEQKVMDTYFVESIEMSDNNIVTMSEQEEVVMPNDSDFVTGWLTDTSNIRCQPSIDSEVVQVLPIGTEISYCTANDSWSYVKINDEIDYVYSELVSSTEVIHSTEYDTPYSERMSFMGYQAITSITSRQYKLQQIAYTGNYGIRQVNGRYCIAVGTAYTTQIGQYLDLVLENGTVIPCILGDCKADEHTDSTNRITVHDGSLVEFIVDKSVLESNAKRMGNIHYACEEWKSRVVKIILYDYMEEF